MEQQEWLAQQFEEERPLLRAVAYRMLGSLSEAEDAVQDAWLRLSRSDRSEVENLRARLTTVVARVALNMLRSRRTRREEPLDVRVPDPIIDPADGTDPAHEALLADSVGLAMLVVLETPTPPERLAFVLHDMFAAPFEEVAEILERSPEAARQLASRARGRVRGAGTVAEADAELPAQWEGSKPSSPRLATATSRRSSPCSTLTWCCARIADRAVTRVRSTERRPSQARRCCSPRTASRCAEPSSTARPGSSRCAMGDRSRSEPSASGRERSSRSTS